MYNIENCLPFFQLVIAAGGFGVTCYMLNRTIKSIKSNTLTSIRIGLCAYDEINEKLMSEPDPELPDEYFKENFGKIVGYLGLIETMGKHLDRKTLDKKDYEEFFTYRVRNIGKDKAIMEYLNGVDSNKWKTLLKMINDVQNQ